VNRQYFLSLANALAHEGFSEPLLVIDLARLHHNIELFQHMLPQGMAYRIVAKSLPSPALLNFVMKKTRSNRLMSFNAEMTGQLLKAFPNADQLLGKPLPEKRLGAFLTQLPAGLKRKQGHIQWLVDTPERLAAYEAIARGFNVKLRISLELDVGLHRGGFSPGAHLQAGLDILQRSQHLTLSGTMGYEPHLTKIPDVEGWRDRAKRGAWKILDDTYDQIETQFGVGILSSLVRNTAGSPTFGLYKNMRHSNELAAGSALVKPSDFDIPLLRRFKPAAFIATPALKVSKGVEFPAHEFANGVVGNVKPGQKIFVHGGYWMASPVFPRGLTYSDIFGRSSNQDLLLAPPNLKIKVDDYVFLRPHQSEAVFLQFPNIVIFDDGKITDIWHPLPVSA
jgi:D-serine deaminase-like pyridoxal phosphate-dependent protein